jgi:hypothetical protein
MFHKFNLFPSSKSENTKESLFNNLLPSQRYCYKALLDETPSALAEMYRLLEQPVTPHPSSASL